MNGRALGKVGCRSPAATARRPTYAGTCMGPQPRPSGALKSWLHASIPSPCLFIPVFLTACHLTTIWADPTHRGSSAWPGAISPTGGRCRSPETAGQRGEVPEVSVGEHFERVARRQAGPRGPSRFPTPVRWPPSCPGPGQRSPQPAGPTPPGCGAHDQQSPSHQPASAPPASASTTLAPLRDPPGRRPDECVSRARVRWTSKPAAVDAGSCGQEPQR